MYHVPFTEFTRENQCPFKGDRRMREDIIMLERQIAELGEKIEAIRDACPHGGTSQTSKRSDKIYFYKLTCHDCGKVIREWSE